jgi:Tfp pilus assembly protein PilE
MKSFNQCTVDEMNPKNIGVSEAAFNRLELFILLAVVCLLASISLPALSSNTSRSQRITCIANLRQIGRTQKQHTTCGAFKRTGHPTDSGLPVRQEFGLQSNSCR